VVNICKMLQLICILL